jgi:hypothetical protein
MASANLAVRWYCEPLRSLAFGSISSSYAALGTAFANPSRQIYIVNYTDVLLTFSLDGTHDHFVVAPNSHFISDIMTNASIAGGSWAAAQGQVIYVKGAPTVNAVYLSTFYGIGAF